MTKNYKLAFASLAIVLAVAAGSFLAYKYNLSQNAQGNIFDDLYYEGYKSFFSWVRNDVTRYKLPDPLIVKLKLYYKSLTDSKEPVSYAYSKRLEDYSQQGYAMTDCYKMYYPKKAMTDSIASAKTDASKFLNKDNKSYVKWLLHEMAHTEQCYNKAKTGSYDKKRKAFANMWVTQVGLKLFQDPSKNIDKIHDAMPMEDAADAKADSVMKSLGLN